MGVAMTNLIVYPHCDMHVALNTTGDLPFRVFEQERAGITAMLPPSEQPPSFNPYKFDLTDVTDACTFRLLAPYNAVGNRLEAFVTIDRDAKTISPVATGINLVVIQHGAGTNARYIVARIQVHDDVLGWWFGNRTITTALDADVAHSQPSIYAMFSDDDSRTDRVGDITGHGYVALSSSDEAIFKVANDHNEGRLQGHSAGTAELTGQFLDISRKIPVTVVDYAKPRKKLVPVRLSDRVTKDQDGNIEDVDQYHNILFLAEGFRESDRAQYDELVAQVVDELLTKPRHEPFHLLGDRFNVFKSFDPWKDHLVTCGFKVNDQPAKHASKTILAKGYPIPYTRRVSQKGKYTLESLIARVGLPLRDEDRSTSDLIDLWKEQSLHNFDENRVDVKLVKAWKKSTSLGFLEARDTFFGLILGRRWADNISRKGAPLDEDLEPLIKRAYEWFKPRGTRRSLTPDPRRHPPELFEHNEESRENAILTYIDGLQTDKAPHQQIGPVWMPESTFKPSRGLIAIIVKEGMDGGTSFNRNTMTAININSFNRLSFQYPNSNSATKKIMRRKPPDEIPMDVDGTINTVAHEFGHSFQLGDEYETNNGDRPNAPDSDDNIAAFNSIFLGDDPDDAQGRKIDPEKIKWARLPRMQRSVTTTQDSTVVNGKIRVTINPRHTPRWSMIKTEGFEVHLRRRQIRANGRQLPLSKADTDLLTDLTIEDVDRKNGTVLLEAPSAIDSSLDPFPAGSLLFVPKTSEGGDQRFVVEKKVLDFLKATHLPLNKDPNHSEASNDPDHPRKIENFKAPCKSSRLIGVFEGAGNYSGMVYRPAGTCKMRSSGGEDENGEFCHVCKWLIVNRVDGGQHGMLDRKFYPEAKKND